MALQSAVLFRVHMVKRGGHEVSPHYYRDNMLCDNGETQTNVTPKQTLSSNVSTGSCALSLLRQLTSFLCDAAIHHKIWIHEARRVLRPTTIPSPSIHASITALLIKYHRTEHIDEAGGSRISRLPEQLRTLSDRQTARSGPEGMIDESTSIPLVCSFASFCLSNINYLDCVSISGLNIYGVVNVFHFLKMMDFFTRVCYLHVVAPQGGGENPRH